MFYEVLGERIGGINYFVRVWFNFFSSDGFDLWSVGCKKYICLIVWLMNDISMIKNYRFIFKKMNDNINEVVIFFFLN